MHAHACTVRKILHTRTRFDFRSCTRIYWLQSFLVVYRSMKTKYCTYFQVVAVVLTVRLLIVSGSSIFANRQLPETQFKSKANILSYCFLTISYYRANWCNLGEIQADVYKFPRKQSVFIFSNFRPVLFQNSSNCYLNITTSWLEVGHLMTHT